jgi:hypothetical protein
VDVRLVLTSEVPVRPTPRVLLCAFASLAAVPTARADEGCEHCSRSKATHDALAIGWEKAARVAPAEGGAPATDAKPLVVFVTDGTEAAGMVESAVFDDERVALGLRAFRAVRMTPEDAGRDPWVSKAGKDAVRLVVASADGSRTKALERGKVSADGLWKALQAEAGAAYEADLAEVVGRARDLLAEFDRVAEARKALDAAAPDAAARKAALDDRQAKAEAAFRALWDLRRRAP